LLHDDGGPDRERLRELLRSLSRPSVILGARPEVDSAVIPERAALAPIDQPGRRSSGGHELLEERHILSREEFLRIVRKSQSAAK